MIYNSKIENLYIKDATIEDVDDILYFINQLAIYEKLEHTVLATKEKLIDTLFVKNCAKVILAVYNGKKVGMALYFYNYSTFTASPNLYLEDLYILDDYRGLKIGKELFRVLSVIAVENGCNRLDFVCIDFNELGLKFYKKINAKKLDEWILHRLEKEELIKMAMEE